MERGKLTLLRIPVATYRVQFNKDFRFTDACHVLPYLSALGMTDIYSSPYLMAKPGSIHGYDIVDHKRINPEIGSAEEYEIFIETLGQYGMGQILDIVPNHMCIESPENVWWMDILENGPSSIYAKYYDIDWEPTKKELKNRVLLPILGDQYGKVLDDKELQICFKNGSFFLTYYSHTLPILPETYTAILTHGIDKLKHVYHQENEDYNEILSIVNAFRNLPHYTEKRREMIIERYREKEIAKRRLKELFGRSRVIRDFINNTIEMINGIKGRPETFMFLEKLLKKQVYRLSDWRVAADEINYRRFFDINGLAALRMERKEVFEDTHSLIFTLVRDRKVTGLRVDHPDGLYNPLEYFHRLQLGCFKQGMLDHIERLNEDVSVSYSDHYIESEIKKQYQEMVKEEYPWDKPFYIVGEKILIKSEVMPEEWPLFSTTGYVFLNLLNGIFVETKSGRAFTEIYERFTRDKKNFQEMVYEKKKLVMHVGMSSEVSTLGNYLNAISEKNRYTRDFTLNTLIEALVETIACFPVYRTYVHTFQVRDRDRNYIEIAIARAKRKNPAVSESVFDFIKNVLLLDSPEGLSEKTKKLWLDFTMRFQQTTGPVMAKGLEDTVFYVYNRLISLNEVGGNPERFGTSLEMFHGHNMERIKHWPKALITTSTHDTKRSEDVRARINVLSEIPQEWKTHLFYWSKINKKKKIMVNGSPVPDRDEEYLLYQTLLGVWPIGIYDENVRESVVNRVKDYAVKAAREAKVNTSWVNPDHMYEEALRVFIDSILMQGDNNVFLKDFLPFQNVIAHCGMYNSLSQTLLKITSPGIPDFYQGTELWDFSLVDPDNRRPVDYRVRSEILEQIKKDEATGLLALAVRLTETRVSGGIKMFLIYKALNFRREEKELFEAGKYIPLEITGEKAECLCAFARQAGNREVIAAVPRFTSRLVADPDRPPVGEEVWGETIIANPTGDRDARYANIFTGEIFLSREYNGMVGLRMADVLGNFPVALLARSE